MDKNQFFEDVLVTVREHIPEELRGIVKVVVSEVLKNNDEKLHGIMMSIEGSNMMPTLYLEDFYEIYKDGESIEEIARMIIDISTTAFKNPPPIADFSFDYDNVKDKLILELLDIDMNKERLETLVHKEVGNGFVVVPYITIEEIFGSAMRTAITKDIAENHDYDIDKLMDVAFLNTMGRYTPVFMAANKPYDISKFSDVLNPMSENFRIDTGRNLYMLTNAEVHYGATVFFYPGIAERIGDILGKNYYVLPSSVHEMMIVPDGMGASVRDLKRLVREANASVVESTELLSNKVFYYNRKKNCLITV